MTSKINQTIRNTISWRAVSGLLLVFIPIIFNGVSHADGNAHCLYSIINKRNPIIVFPRYDNISRFSEGLAPFKTNDKWGYLDRNGAVHIKPQFEYAFPFSDGLAKVTIKEKDSLRDGFIDHKGGFVVKPVFTRAHSFYQGRAFVYIDKLIPVDSKDISQNLERQCIEVIATIDKKGELIDTGDERHYYRSVNSFREGLAVACAFNNKYGYIDIDGRTRIAPVFDNAEDFREGLAVVRINNKYGYIDIRGKTRIQCRFERAEGFHNGLAAVNIGGSVDQSYDHRWEYTCDYGGKWGFINKNGEFLVNPIYQAVLPFNEHLASVAMNNKWGYIDSGGTVTIDFQFDDAGPFSEGLANVKINNRWGFIDATGRLRIPPAFKATGGFYKGIAPAANHDGKWGCIDNTGSWIIEPAYDEIFYCDDEMTIVKKCAGNN